MRRIMLVLVTLLIALLFVCNGTSVEAKSRKKVKLWRPIKPYATDYLKVSDIHEVYYELCGNKEGKPVLVLHGGPGGGCSPYMRRFFNPKKFHIVLHDQRGAGRSKPYAEIRQNTTQDLVQDIERLRKHLKLPKIILFGGSWGTTLALAYAETYPANVSGMVFRGVYTATREEQDYIYQTSKFFPEALDRLLKTLPESEKRPLHNYVLELLESANPTEREKYSKAWTRFEFKAMGLEIPDEEVDKMLEEYDPSALAILESHYFANGLFLEENQLLRNVARIQNIPVIIVNGRYDVICPPIFAYRLHKKLPKSQLIIVEESGHWMGEKGIEAALLKAIREFE